MSSLNPNYTTKNHLNILFNINIKNQIILPEINLDLFVPKCKIL